MVGLIAALGPPVLAAYPVLAYCDRGARRGTATVGLRLCLALGIGAGLSAAGYFLWLFFVGPPGTTYHVCETAAWLAIAGFGWTRCATAGLSSTASGAIEQTDQQAARLSAASRSPPRQRLLTLSFVAALALAAIGAIANYRNSPLGDWDAWTIWNQRARFLFRGGPQWRQAFSPAFAHRDYPLLLPCSNARLWSYLGAEAAWVPWLLGTLFTLATVGLLAAAVCRLRSQSQGVLAGLTLLGMVPFLDRGSLQYADVPLAFFLLAAVLLLALYDASWPKGTGTFFSAVRRTQGRSRSGPKKMSQSPARAQATGCLVLSGLMAGLAAWTKNEGLVLLLVLPAARGLTTWRRNGFRGVMVEWLVWTVGVLPPLALVVIQKLCLAGGNEFVTGQSWSVLLAKLADPWRYAMIAQAFAVHAMRIARPFAVVAPLYYLLIGRRKHSTDAGSLPTAGAVLLLMLAAYFAIYLVTPCELGWHLATSAERLLLHLTPLGVWILFLGLATPEEIISCP